MVGWADGFLENLEPRTWSAPDAAPKAFKPSLLFLGKGDHPLEAALASCSARPKADDVRKMWTARQGRRPSPLLLIIGYPENGATRLTVCGPVGEHPPLIHGLPVSQVERLAAAALDEPNRHAAVRFLAVMLPEAESDLPGLRNSGLLATQELRNGVPARSDWTKATATGKLLLDLAGRSLIEGLGFSVVSLSVNSSVLTVGDGIKRAVAIFLDEAETFDVAAQRFQGTSPVSHALAQADKEGLSWVVLTRSRQIRLYAARPDTGVGRKGRAETFVEANLALLPEDKAGYLQLLFGADALVEGGTTEDILERSADFAADLAARLRDRVYFDTVPQLAAAVAARLGDTSKLTDYDLAQAYEQTLIILFRLLFVAYAEDKDLLPYRSNSRYSDHSLKHLARRLADDRRAGKEDFDDVTCALWADVCELWDAVDHGNTGWGVPSYNGGLFSNEVEINVAGAALARIKLTDAEFGTALTAMLVDEGTDGVIGPVDFRSLSVREFGTIYEGLLESMLSVAPSDLSTDARGNYVPAKKSDEVIVRAGDVYFHNRSGARKATGSYFTKPFAVEHLLHHALEPALDDHLSRVQRLLDDGDEAAAADAFFDFRCADLAMGSGHFLVAAVDRIEARLSNFLALHPIPAINAELDSLHRAALDALGDLADGVEIETTGLLRRQVARRCIYGVDLNHISVELARLSIWIHTFVPGLPLSFLDHSLVCGNSLTGIGTLDEALEVLDPDHGTDGQVSLFRADIEQFIERASGALQRLARIVEANSADIEEARRSHKEALAAVEPARHLFDILVAARLGETDYPVSVEEARIAKAPDAAKVKKLASDLQTLHFPTEFPEVFTRDYPGFDCIVGNPPWEEPVVEELQFWAIRFPGLKAMTNTEQAELIADYRRDRPDLAQEFERAQEEARKIRRSLSSGAFPGMGVGDPDLYKAFIWRFVRLTRQGGSIGVVLPRSVFVTKGASEWRTTVLPTADSLVVFTKNRAEWLFTDVNPGYPVALVTMSPGVSRARLRVCGTYESLDEFRRGLRDLATEIPLDRLAAVDPLLCVPSVDSDDALELFSLLIKHPAFGNPSRGDWRARPHTELHATNDAAEFFTDDPSEHPIFNHTNIGHFLFQPENGAFNYTDFKTAVDLLQERRSAIWGAKNSPFTEMPRKWALDKRTLPARNPRIAVRDVVHSTNPRKVWAAVVPGKTILTNKAPYLLFPRGDIRSQAFVLGFLGSSVADWFGHLRVNLNLNYFILNSIPIPIDDHSSRANRLAEIAAGLALPSTATKGNYGEWVDLANPMEDDGRGEALAELDAVASLMYGLSDAMLCLVWNRPTRPDIDDVRRFRQEWTNR